MYVKCKKQAAASRHGKNTIKGLLWMQARLLSLASQLDNENCRHLIRSEHDGAKIFPILGVGADMQGEETSGAQARSCLVKNRL